MYYATIDDVLGPSVQRYFGEGYRQVQARLRVPQPDDTKVPLYGELEYPIEWSLRSGVVRRDTHLGTIDAVVLACRAAEILTTGDDHVVSVDINAGSAPVVSLEEVPISLAGTQGPELTLALETLRVELQFAGGREFRSAGEVPNWMTEPAGMSTAPISLLDLQIEERTTTARASASPTTESRWQIDSRPHALPVADTIAAAGALAEASLFTQTRVQRDNVGNFWMRKANIRFHDNPAAPVDGSIRVDTLRSVALRREGRVWHSARVLVQSDLGFEIHADLAFEDRTGKTQRARFDAGTGARCKTKRR